MPSRENKRAQAILAAAEAILRESGIEALTARAIAERAGVQKGLVFYYWDSTADLVDDVLERYYRRHLDVLRSESADPDAPLTDRIHQLIDSYLDFMEQNRSYTRIIQNQLSSADEPSPVVGRYLSEMMQLTSELIGSMTPTTGPLSAKHFFLSLSGVVVNYFTYAPALGDKAWGKRPLGKAALKERRAHIHWLVDAWLNALKTRESTT